MAWVKKKKRPSSPMWLSKMFRPLSDVLASSTLHVPTTEPHGSDTCRRAVWTRKPFQHAVSRYVLQCSVQRFMNHINTLSPQSRDLCCHVSTSQQVDRSLSQSTFRSCHVFDTLRSYFFLKLCIITPWQGLCDWNVGQP